MACCYLISGEEQALTDTAMLSIMQKAQSADDQQLSVTVMDAKGCSASEVESNLRTGSLFGGRRVVIVKDAQSLHPQERKKLCAYLAKPVRDTTLVVVVRGAGPKTRDPKKSSAASAARAYQKAVEKGSGVLVDCPRPSARQLPRLAKQYLQEAGLGVDEDGLYALVDAVGEDLGALIQAVEKLSLYKLGKGRVSVDDVSMVVADTRNESVFELLDAVAEGNQRKALGGLRRMLRDGQSPLALLSHLTRHFRNMAQVQALSKRGESQKSIQTALGLHPFVVKKALQQSRRFTTQQLAQRLKLLAENDRKLKGGPVGANLQLELLISSLCEVRSIKGKYP